MHRLFIDETGTHDLTGAQDPNNRFLSLTGLIFSFGEIERRLVPGVARLKQKHFPHAPEPEAIILHRKDIINRRPPFEIFSNPNKEDEFNDDLLTLLSWLRYTAITVTIDKLEHLERYSVWHIDPYHYCLEAMMERYCMHMNVRSVQGDVMIESRDKRQDKKLKKLFSHIYNNGTEHLSDVDLQKAMTSRELKLKPKRENIAGLQLCDLIAHPACIMARCLQDGTVVPENFGARISAIVEGKYRRSPRTNKIDGWGRKWLP